MDDAVIKGAGYILAHVPNLTYEFGTTQVLERLKDPESPYLAKLKEHLRTYEQALAYPPFQAYIGNLHPDDLAAIPRPWYEGEKVKPARTGPYGEIVPEDEFYAWMLLVDTFDLVWLDEKFLAELKVRLEKNPLVAPADLKKLGSGKAAADIAARVQAGSAAPLYLGGRLVGCVRQAHEVDDTLAAHVMAENVASKASAVLVLRHLLAQTGTDPKAVDYIIEASEEACGDMNQRGGGNFAKAIGEWAGCLNATGSDTRGFCAGPTHALIHAAALVKAGFYKSVVVVGGGAMAKLGMNGRDHVAKGLPVLEDVLGGFAILVAENDGVNPVIRGDSLGKHNIGSGSSPQAVMQALVADPLERLGLRLSDVDKYSVEMQIPEITEPAGAGDVPTANFKMIAALAVMRKEIERSAIAEFVARHGMPGFAPTQGHIPSGVPFIGHARDQILAGKITRAMIIGKGSLFLGRMTNLFDGVSFLLERNPGRKSEEAAVVDEAALRKLVASALRRAADELTGGEG
ncbi:glycine/sarcosine/betaine reductase complex component C subunit beta [Gelria sp. Kuro-4]|uniref:glycine/sarcosine/betaine reductase complex component C subunit beta n=1 Tax=Gelria sp. Kuro-4 TaxID=2796927 RepID=UPI001BF0FCDD|nr:glycine/sarcosine/betaine reductase complex component C subunit beta [Gelria sp. Kuro-4]BCV23810.1 glycine/betaine reductase C [Gelria sp. Kuro-4]